MEYKDLIDLAYDMANKTILWGNYKNTKEAKANFPITFINIKTLNPAWVENELIYWSARWRSNYFTHNADGEKKLKQIWIRAIYNKLINDLNPRDNAVNIISPINNDIQHENNLITNALRSLRDNV